MKGAMLRTITRRAVQGVNHMAMWLIWLAGMKIAVVRKEKHRSK